MEQRDQHARDHGQGHSHEESRRRPEERQLRAGAKSAGEERGRVPAHERRHEHDALEADVDHAGSLAHHPAERGERDRNRDGDGRAGDEVDVEDDVADELKDEAEDRNGVEGLRDGAHWTASVL
jgi:hypothetical protein